MCPRSHLYYTATWSPWPLEEATTVHKDQSFLAEDVVGKLTPPDQDRTDSLVWAVWTEDTCLLQRALDPRVRNRAWRRWTCISWGADRVWLLSVQMSPSLSSCVKSRRPHAQCQKCPQTWLECIETISLVELHKKGLQKPTTVCLRNSVSQQSAYLPQTKYYHIWMLDITQESTLLRKPRLFFPKSLLSRSVW